MAVLRSHPVPTLRLLAAVAGMSIALGTARAQNINESEPNQTKVTATPVVLTTPGDGDLGQITGHTTGAVTTGTGDTTVDYYKITVPADPTPGIYRYEISLFTTGATNYTTTLRGLTQTSTAINTTSDATFQTNNTNNSVTGFDLGNAFYAFGSAAQVYYRVAGTTATTDNYTAIVSRATVAPTEVLQTFQPGPITISTLNLTPTTSTDTAFIVLDSNFNPVSTFKNNNATVAGGAPAASTQSYCTRTLAAGTYYIAVSLTNLANNERAATDDGTKTTAVLDFPGVLATSFSAPSTVSPFSVQIGDGCRVVTVPTTISVPSGFHDVYSVDFVKFTVGAVDAPCVQLVTSPSAPLANSTLTLSATVTPATSGSNTITSVVADLTAFGGSTATAMSNSGGSNVWTVQAPIDYVPGVRAWSATATDAANRTAFNNSFVTVTPIVPPNDACSNAIVVGALPATYSLGIHLATSDGISLPCVGAQPIFQATANGVWWSYTAATSGLLDINAATGGPYVAVFDGSAGCGSLGTPLICSNAGGDISVVAGHSYLIYVARDAQTASTNNNDIYTVIFNLFNPTPPPNDDCAHAIDVTSIPFNDQQLIGGAHSEPPNICMLSAVGGAGTTEMKNGIWYHYHNAGSFCQLLFGTQTGGACSIFKGSCSGPEVYCNTSVDNIETFVMNPNTDYYFLFGKSAIFNSSNNTYAGPAEMCSAVFTQCEPAPAAPANDACSNPIVITSTPFSDSQLIVSAERDDVPGVCNGKKTTDIEANGIWYTYTPHAPQHASFSQLGTQSGEVVFFTGACGNFTSVICSDKESDPANVVDLEPNTTYHILVFNMDSDTSLNATLAFNLTTVANGACCMPDHTCTYVQAAGDCTGTFSGLGTACTPNPCAAGICCRGSICDATMTTQATCNAATNPAGLWSSLGGTCNTSSNYSSPCCSADYDKNNVVNVNDIFAFLRGWFAHSSFANANQTGAVDVNDIFAFLRAWFATNGHCSTS